MFSREMSSRGTSLSRSRPHRSPPPQHERLRARPRWRTTSGEENLRSPEASPAARAVRGTAGGRPSGGRTGGSPPTCRSSPMPPSMQASLPTLARRRRSQDSGIANVAVRVVAMNLRVWDRMRRDLDELVGARLDVATFCAEAGPQLARVVPSCAGAAELQTWYALDPCSLLVTGVYGPECEIDTAAQMRWEYVDEDVNISVDVVRNLRSPSSSCAGMPLSESLDGSVSRRARSKSTSATSSPRWASPAAASLWHHCSSNETSSGG